MVSIFCWCILYILDHKQELHQKESIVTYVSTVLTLFLPVETFADYIAVS